jgi:putative ABC transport system permease protein
MMACSRADVRDAVRSLRASPTVTICTVGCLALGIAATAAVASAVDRALVRQLPFRDPTRLVTVYRTTPQSNA